MTCDLCSRPGIARDGDSLLCLACWSARHVVQPTDPTSDRSTAMRRPHPRWTTDNDDVAAAYAGDYLDPADVWTDEDIADYRAADDVPGRWVA